MANKYYDYPACKELIAHTCVFYAKWYARFILEYPLLHEMMEQNVQIYIKRKGNEFVPTSAACHPLEFLNSDKHYPQNALRRDCNGSRGSLIRG